MVWCMSGAVAVRTDLRRGHHGQAGQSPVNVAPTRLPQFVRLTAKTDTLSAAPER